MSDLIVIGYPDEATAEAAADEARRLARDLIIQPDAIAAITRDAEGKIHVHTQHHAVGTGAVWGMFWGMLFGLLFFVPFFGLAVGAAMGALIGHFSNYGIDQSFIEQVRSKVTPGTSALFLLSSGVVTDRVAEAVKGQQFEIIQTNLSKEQEDKLRADFGE